MGQGKLHFCSYQVFEFHIYFERLTFTPVRFIVMDSMYSSVQRLVLRSRNLVECSEVNAGRCRPFGPLNARLQIFALELDSPNPEPGVIYTS